VSITNKTQERAMHADRATPNASRKPSRLAPILSAACLLCLAGVGAAGAQTAAPPATQSPATQSPDVTPAPEPRLHTRVRTTVAGGTKTVYHLLGFALRGTKRVDTDKLVATLPQHEGDAILAPQIEADADAMSAALRAHHVYGDLTTMLVEQEGPGHHVWVIWNLQPLPVPVLYKAARRGVNHFGGETFTGNTKLDSVKLTIASGLHPGDKLTDRDIGEARAGIEQAYDTVLPGAKVRESAKIKVTADNSVFIDWQIIEPKPL
jgi:hypothetical protein